MVLGAKDSKSSFSAFNEVDDQVAKPVIGSDGASRWQDFKQGAGKKTAAAGNSLLSVAPSLPLKRIDRVGLGIKSINDERSIEAEVRKEAGDREVGAGYTVFKTTDDHEERAAQKKRKLILDRVRPDDATYFMKAETFEGYKEDYVFTTKDRGTGYYWDGMDSVKRELGQSPTYSGSSEGGAMTVGGADRGNHPKEKVRTKKRKKKSVEATAVPDSDPYNPMEQVAQAILRRKQALDAPPSVLLGMLTTASDAAALGAGAEAVKLLASSQVETLEPELVAAGWEATKDPTSGKTYYFRRSTNEQCWNKPALPKKIIGQSDNNLPEGWKSTADSNSGKVYYYHTSGKTSWEKPMS